ncbi:hypothetical protein ACFFRR_010592 [Megaselia abdita]
MAAKMNCSEKTVRNIKLKQGQVNWSDLRPIERYWALMKRELKSTNKSTQDVSTFLNKWNCAANTIEGTTIRALISVHFLLFLHFPEIMKISYIFLLFIKNSYISYKLSISS